MPADGTSTGRIRAALEAGLGGGRTVVVGDQMLDRYVRGAVRRISPEAPVPVLHKSGESSSAGGAANVALNLAGLDVDTAMVSVVGDDTAGGELCSSLDAAGVSTSGVLRVAGRRTTVKTRILTDSQQLLRVDDEDTGSCDASTLETLLAAMDSHLDGHTNAVVLSDYRKGLLSEAVCQACIRLAGERDIRCFVDPKGPDYRKYRGADVITPNLAELELVTGVDRQDSDGLIRAGRQLIEDLDIGCLVLTRGADGLTCVVGSEVIHSPAEAQEVFDVTGAGDTVVAAMAAARTAGLDWADTLRLANVAAGLVVRRIGAVAVTREELLDAFAVRGAPRSASVLGRDELIERIGAWRRRGDRIVFTNGCFDILHAGHLSYLTAAATEGERLVVAINSDASVRKLKGQGRPVNAELDRAALLASLKGVDAVTVFDEDTPLDLVLALRPDVLVKGADYAGKSIAGAAEVESWGGRVVLAPFVEGYSSTAVLKKRTD